MDITLLRKFWRFWLDIEWMIAKWSKQNLKFGRRAWGGGSGMLPGAGNLGLGLR